MRVGERARKNSEQLHEEAAERHKNDPPGSVGAQRAPPEVADAAPKPIKRPDPTDDQLADIFANSIVTIFVMSRRGANGSSGPASSGAKT